MKGRPDKGRSDKGRQERQGGRAASVVLLDVDETLNRYIWLLVPLLVIVYYWWFSSSPGGFYQDDEIGHYRNIRQFWQEPFSIMGNQPKPGWKILMVLPGLLGFKGVAIAHCLVAALTVLATYFLGRTLKIRNSSVMALLLAAQPLFLQLSFRSYSEITAGLFAVLMLLFYYRGNYALAALASSYIFSIRQEFAIVSIGLGIVLLYRRKWVPFLLLAWTPLVLALIGWLATGNALWLLDDMRRIGLGVEVPHRPFWHYFGALPFIVGPVALALFTVGYFAVLGETKDWKAALTRHGFLLFTFTSMWAWAVISAWDYLNAGANPGHWRYLLSIMPLVAVYAGKGLTVIHERKQKALAAALLGACALLALAFVSREADGFLLTDVKSYVVSGMVLFFAAVSIAFLFLARGNGGYYLAFTAAAMILHTALTIEPIRLQPEGQCMKDASDWYAALPEGQQARPLYCNHVLFKYFSDIDIQDPLRDRRLALDELAKAPKGSIIVWESHYGKSQFGGDVPMEFFENNPSYRFLKQFMATDQRFGALAFEKVQ
jgi:hypothetical protein